MGRYSTDCTPQTPLRCESGDLGSKHGRLTISQPTATRVTYSYVDSNLNLFGPANSSSKSLAHYNKMYTSIYAIYVILLIQSLVVPLVSMTTHQWLHCLTVLRLTKSVLLNYYSCSSLQRLVSTGALHTHTCNKMVLVRTQILLIINTIMFRVNFTGDLTRNTGISSSDVLILSQEITNRGRARQMSGTQCVNMTVRVLGASGKIICVHVM